MAFSGIRRLRTALSIALVAALGVGLGAIAVTPAYADGPPVTLSLATVNPSTNTPITEVVAGTDFTYTASVGCPDSQCGPATLTVAIPADVQFKENSFNSPQGSTFEYAPNPNPAAGEPSGTLTITWANLTSNAVIYIPVTIAASLSTSQNGTDRTAESTLVAGETETSTLTKTTDLSLVVYDAPGLTNQSQSWSQNQLLDDGSRPTITSSLTGTATANSPSTLTFTAPNGANPPTGALLAADAFDITALHLDKNPKGAAVTLTFEDGSTQPRTLAAGTTDLDLTSTPGVVGYTVVLSNVDSVEAAPAAGDRTFTVTADYKLREEARNGAAIIESGKTQRTVRANGTVTNSVANNRPGQPAADAKDTQADVTITSYPIELKHSIVLDTASGDQTSVYESGESSSLVVTAANSGIPGVQSIAIQLPKSGTYFDYQELTANPEVQFPDGAVRAVIQYRYAPSATGGQTTNGEPLSFVPGDAVPGPADEDPASSPDPRTLERVSGISVTFYAADGSVIPGEQTLTGPGAASITLSAKLRDRRQSDNAPISAPPGNPGETQVPISASITAKGSSDNSISQDTTTATLLLVKPQFKVELGKRIGEEDGTDLIVYPPTGIAKAGDVYDTTPNATQNFRDHELQLVASTKKLENATEPAGARELTIVDPQTAPTIASLGSTPFNTVKFTSIADAPAVCTTTGGAAVASTTTQSAWVLDALTDPTSVTLLPLDQVTDLELVVGLEISVTPAGGASRFPLEVRCAAAPGTKVQFRETRISDGVTVSPANLGAENTPGLFSAGNTAELRTGKNTATATGSDSLFLVDLVQTVLSKQYERGAARFGNQGEHSPTSFVLAGVPGIDDTTKTKMTDGRYSSGSPVEGESFDVFELTGVRDAQLGPDQQMTIRFFDSDRNAIGPVGTVAPSIELDGENLTAAEIDDSQNPKYREFREVKRDIDWDAQWTSGDMARVASVEAEITRANTSDPLQTLGSFAVVLDTKLRSNFLTRPGTAVAGAPNGIIYENVAEVASLDANGDFVEFETQSHLKYTVYAATELFADAQATWTQATTAAEPYLVAHDETPSRITLKAANRTAVGVADVDPENQWSANGSISVGMEALTIGVSGAPGDGVNPFAITEFSGITSMTWPVRNGAKADESNTDRRVAGKITYTVEDGQTFVVDAPVGASAQALNPPVGVDWSKIVGVSVTWAEDGKFIGATRPPVSGTENYGSIVFTSTLLHDVRDGYSYTFVEGDPISLASGDSIAGATDNGENTIPQRAVLTGDYRGELTGFDPVEGAAESGKVLISTALHPVEAGAEVTTTNLYRDLATRPSQSPTQWTLSLKNKGNLAVSSLWFATDTSLLDTATWPQDTPSDYVLAPGSAFDAFNVTGAKVSFPAGAASATVWALGEDGTWSQPMQVTTSGAQLQLPIAATGPQSWADVVGFRVQFDADPAAPSQNRIAKEAKGSLIIDTQLRATLRSDSNEKSPATALAAGADSWKVPITTGGLSHVDIPGTGDGEMDSTVREKSVLAGGPAPRAGKYVRPYIDGGVNVKEGLAEPGQIQNFYIVLMNDKNATSNLYNLGGIDTVPAELNYNAANAWSVVHKPSSFTEDPEVTISTSDPTTIRWNWTNGEMLKPGEFVMLRVPLQVTDGLAPGLNATNSARIVGSGIENAVPVSRCDTEDSTNTSCTSEAYVKSTRSDSARVEKYINADALGSALLSGAACDATSEADWDGSWVRNPCVANTTVDGTVKYRIKLINSGNSQLKELRFVDSLPKIGDRGTVLPAPRGSAWTPSLIPDSVTVLTGADAAALGAREDAELKSPGLRYSPDANACALDPDAYSGANTLACAQSTWTDTATSESAAVAGDIVFADGAGLDGGEYVVVEFSAKVPGTSTNTRVAWNSAAVTARSGFESHWFPASESATTGAKTQDTELTLALDLPAGPVTDWHLLAEKFDFDLSCTVPGETDPVTKHASIERDENGNFPSVTIGGLPIGGTCEVVNETYAPDSPTQPGQYGQALGAQPEDAATGYSFASDPVEPLVLDADPAENTITVTNTFVDTSVELGVEVTGNAAGMLPADAEFELEMSCSFGGVTKPRTGIMLADGGTITVDNLPVGAVCAPAEVDDRGATNVTVRVSGDDADEINDLSMKLKPLNPGEHSVIFVNSFEAGGALNVLKRVELPRAGLSAGDVEFAVSCELGGYPLELGELSTLKHTFAPGETEATLPVPGLPVGAQCTVHETVAGGADVPAPDRTATVLADEDVTVEMVNVFNPAALELSKELTGPGAGESRVPSSFDLRATCTRDLTVGGKLVTVTDFDAISSVTPGSPVTVPALPEGSLCAVTEPKLGGAESVRIESLTNGVVDEDPSSDAALVKLVGPDANGDPVATRVRATNHFVATDSIGTTGGQGGATAAMLALLLLGLGGGALVLRRRTRA